MVTLLLLLRLLPMLCGGHRQVALENLALRNQLAVYKKMVNWPKLLSSDRLFWVAWSRVWAGWRQALVIVSPNTVLRWQHRRFREYWARLSARPAAGRPRVSRQIRALVGRMGCAFHLFVRSGLRRPPQVLVMQSTDAWHLYHPALARQLHTARLGCVFRQR